MFRFNKYLLFVTILSLLVVEVNGKENLGLSGKKAHSSNKKAAACDPATSMADLDINNVRARLLAGGDMWWDLSNARYEVPKVEQGSGRVSVSSLFAGALWIGGIDAGGQLKIAAQTYRQGGNDFWPGYLNDAGAVTDAICAPFDKHWKVNLSDIQAFRAISLQNAPSGSTYGPVPVAQIPTSILEWPGKGNPHAVGANSVPLNLPVDKNLAPFVDVNGDEIYNPEDGDYPALYHNSAESIPDQMIWWVYNDKGDIHSETGGEAIGLEVRTHAFAFATNDEINNMTFYKYEVSNYSTFALDSVYFGQWVDADLGYAFDDYVGVDADRSLGICYNGDAIDGPAAVSYGANPPIVGVDFFQGPIKYIYDNGGNVPVDSVRLGMSKFLYYNNDFSVIGNPEIASHFYGYLSGTWKDGTPVTYGGNGKGGSVLADFMFPGDPGSGVWNECDEGNPPDDRRFIQSSGPFRLTPGARNEVVVGVVWVQPNIQTGCLADFDALRVADDKAQALFNNNFKILNGPDAPDLKIRELDKTLIISLYNGELSNNKLERYEETDPIIKAIVENLNDPSITDSTYNFQGYKIYQLKNAQVSPADFSDLTRARLIAQVDIRDNVSKLVNFAFDPFLGADVPTLMVNGENTGIKHTFVVTEDAFATGDKRLVNHKTYYFSAVTYAYNEFLPYDPADPQTQREPYKEGRNNIKVYSAIPHKPAPLANGTNLNAEYGDGPEIKRIEGAGNGGNILDLTAETITEILNKRFLEHPVYQRSLGPIDVMIYDPLKVPNAEFEVVFNDPTGSNGVLSPLTTWTIKSNLPNDSIRYSDHPIGVPNQQLFPDWGLSVFIKQVQNPGFGRELDNGFLEASKTYSAPEVRWLRAIPEGEFGSIFNWIRSGAYLDDQVDANNKNYADYQDNGVFLDEEEAYETILGSTWAPFALFGGLRATLGSRYMPADNIPGMTVRIDSLASIDVVFTPDKSKWTKCIVVEMSDDRNLTEGNVIKMAMRQHASWTGEVNSSGEPIYDQSEIGRSWFPGYAINLETGERLNMIFSEDSWIKAENGGDMIWNPTSVLSGTVGGDLRFGGKHYIYISNTRYDEGAAFHSAFINDQTATKNSSRRKVFETVIWGSPAMLNAGYQMKPISEGLVPTETVVRLRVAKPYRKFVVTGENNGYNKYTFSTANFAPITNSDTAAENALDLIRAVPNPYYGYSQYEQSQLDNKIKITNLPAKCTVTIYSTDGTMIRRFNREVPADVSSGAEVGTRNFDTSLDWDLRNNKNVPVASGIYLIHVDAPGIGEKVIKWMGVMRPVDLDTF